MLIRCLLCVAVLLGLGLAVTDKQIDKYLDYCLKGPHHKSKPGPEVISFHHCSPWKGHACCRENVTKQIEESGVINLYGVNWNQCPHIKNMTAQCRKMFEVESCFFDCSPYMKPWLKKMSVPNATIKERFWQVPVCAQECDRWFEACQYDYTCSDNWLTTSVTPCTKECKTFKEYYKDSTQFCQDIWGDSFKYTKSTPGEDCLLLWPNGTTNVNQDVARTFARKALESKATKLSQTSRVFGWIIVILGLANVLPL